MSISGSLPPPPVFVPRFLDEATCENMPLEELVRFACHNIATGVNVDIVSAPTDKYRDIAYKFGYYMCAIGKAPCHRCPVAPLGAIVTGTNTISYRCHQCSYEVDLTNFICSK